MKYYHWPERLGCKRFSSSSSAASYPLILAGDISSPTYPLPKALATTTTNCSRFVRYFFA
jgi:hypothetical protein